MNAKFLNDLQIQAVFEKLTAANEDQKLAKISPVSPKQPAKVISLPRLSNNSTPPPNGKAPCPTGTKF